MQKITISHRSAHCLHRLSSKFGMHSTSQGINDKYDQSGVTDLISGSQTLQYFREMQVNSVGQIRARSSKYVS